VSKIITADETAFSNISGLGPTIHKKINEEIKSVIKKTNLVNFMAASQCFGRGISIKKIKLIIDKYPNLLNTDWDVKKLTNRVLEVKGFDDKTAEQFSNNYNKFKDFLQDISKVINLDHLKKKINKKGTKMKDIKIVFTGGRDKALEEYIEKNGGTISGTVTSNTTIVVYSSESDKNNSKIKKAESLKIDTVTHSEFKNKYKINI